MFLFFLFFFSYIPLFNIYISEKYISTKIFIFTMKSSKLMSLPIRLSEVTDEMLMQAD